MRQDKTRDVRQDERRETRRERSEREEREEREKREEQERERREEYQLNVQVPTRLRVPTRHASTNLTCEYTLHGKMR